MASISEIPIHKFEEVDNGVYRLKLHESDVPCMVYDKKFYLHTINPEAGLALVASRTREQERTLGRLGSHKVVKISEISF